MWNIQSLVELNGTEAVLPLGFKTPSLEISNSQSRHNTGGRGYFIVQLQSLRHQTKAIDETLETAHHTIRK